MNRSGDTADPVTVHYATSDGTALAGADYAATSGTLTFAAGQTSKSFSVSITNDSIAESDETLTLTLSSAIGSGATLGSPATAVLTILDNDSPIPGQLQFSSANYQVVENAGKVTITVSRVNGSDGAVSVLYSTADGTAGISDIRPPRERFRLARARRAKRSPYPFATTVSPNRMRPSRFRFRRHLAEPVWALRLARSSHHCG